MSTISTVEFNLGTYSIYNKAMQAFEDATVTGNLYTVAGVTDGTSALRKLSMAELVMVVGLARAAEKEKAIINLMKEMENTTKVLEGLTDIEKKLLEGTNINNITGNYSYNGIVYTKASSFLMAVGIVPGAENLASVNKLCDYLEAGTPFFEINDTFSFNGTNYSAYDFLDAASLWDAMNSSSYDTQLHASYILMNDLSQNPPETVLSDSSLQGIGVYYGIATHSGMTVEEVLTAMETKYDPMLLDRLTTIIGSSTLTYITTSSDDLISEIESKMDSLNSFSQQKMIELQSETNKRDQAYDMITNILKSLNTVQVGIVNNM